jgi:hypothetical protein
VKNLAAFGLYALLGYYAVTKALPVVVAKIESIGLDAVWRVWDERELM